MSGLCDLTQLLLHFTWYVFCQDCRGGLPVRVAVPRRRHGLVIRVA